MPKIVQDEEVYRAVIQNVIEWGYNGSTTKQIAEAADISEVTLFRKYGSKAELVKQSIAFMVAESELAAAARYTGDITADLQRVVAAYQEAARRNRGSYLIILSEIPRHPELADLAGQPLNMIRGLEELLAKYQEEGVLEEEHPLSAAAALLGPLVVGNLMRNATQDVPLPGIDLKRYVQQFLDGRRPSGN